MKKQKVPTLQTERLYLRMWDKKDAADLYAYAQNPNVGPIAGWKPHSSKAESKAIITEFFRKNTVWAIIDKETNRAVGSIGFSEDKMRPGINSRDLGYSLSEEYWGRGFMTEAARRIIEYAFDVMRLDVLSINTMESNLRSQRVIEKCGFKYEGTLRRAYRIYDGSVKTIKCYSILRKEYLETGKRGKENGQKG